MTPEQFEAFEEARAESARIGWEPYMHNPSLPHLLRGTKIPTLLVWGANDPLSSLATADKLNAAIKGSRKVVFDEAGHYPFLEHADKFNSLVLEFLKSPS